MNPIEKSESLKKALRKNHTFDEAEYYRDTRVEIGGDDALNESDEEDPEDEDDEEEVYYGDED